MDRTIRFRNWLCTIRFRTYPDGGRPALVLHDVVDDEMIAVASVNLPDEPLPPGHVFIKDWSENEGILAALVRGGIVADTGIRIPTGFVEAALCRILVEVSG